jgi:hypothetical protein
LGIGIFLPVPIPEAGAVGAYPDIVLFIFTKRQNEIVDEIVVSRRIVRNVRKGTGARSAEPSGVVASLQA